MTKFIGTWEAGTTSPVIYIKWDDIDTITHSGNKANFTMKDGKGYVLKDITEITQLQSKIIEL